MVKLPRVERPNCTREIAAGLVAGRPTKSRLWRHDAPGTRRDADGVLVSCLGSLAIVDLPTPGVQLGIEIEIEASAPAPADAMALF